MSATVGSLNIEVQLALNKLQGQFDTLTQKVNQNNARLNSSFKGLSDSIRSQFTALIPAVTLGSMLAFEKSLFSGAANLEHAADAARVGVEEFQVLGYLARHSGSDIDALTRALDRMQLNIEKASTGDKGMQQYFRELGISIEAIEHLSPERQFEMIGQAVAHASDPTQAWAAAVEILGVRTAPRLMEALKRLGVEGFDAVAEKARASGQVMDKEAAAILQQRAIQAEDLWTQIKNRASEMTALIFAKGDVEGLQYQIRYWKELGNNEEWVTQLEKELAVAIRTRAAAQAAAAAATAQTASVSISFMSAEEQAALKLKSAHDALDARAAILDPSYDDKVAAAKDRMAEATRKANLAEMSDADQIINLRQQALELEIKSNDAGLTTLDQLKAKTDSENLYHEAGAKTETQIKALDAANEALAKADQKVSDREETKIDQLETLRNRVEQAQKAYDDLIASFAGAPADDADVLEATIKATVKLTAAKQDLAQVTQWATSRSQAWISSFETDAEKYQRALHEISVLEEKGFLSVEQGAKAAREAWESLDPVGKEITKTFTEIYSSLSSEGSKAFAEMVLDGRSSFSDLVRIVEEAVLEMAAKLAIINPLINAMFNLGGTKNELASWWSIRSLFGGFFAGGGRPSTGAVSVVGESGPELFIPDSPGTIIPAHALAAVGEGGDSFTFNYSIPTGVTRAELMPALRMSQEQTISRIMAMKRQGGGRSTSL